MYAKACLDDAHRALCYFAHAKIVCVYVCMQSVYVIVVFMNTSNLHAILNINFSLYILEQHLNTDMVEK